MLKASWLSLDLGRFRDRREALVDLLISGNSWLVAKIKSSSRRLSAAWRRLSLVRRFILISSAVVLLGMLTIGFWVSNKIEHGVTQYSAATSALYVDGMIAPLAQELGKKNEISAERAAKIDEIIRAQGRSASRIVAVKLWKRGGVIAYSTWKELIGKKFEPTANLKAAWTGKVSAEYDHVTHEDGSIERSEGKQLLEVYAPILSIETGEIIAVSEFYIAADGLSDQLSAAVSQSWLVVGSTTVAIVLALFGLVSGANTTIERQSREMRLQIASLQELVNQNRQLSERLRRAYLQSASMHERLLRRLGSDLHDGPAQLLGLALIRLDSIFSMAANDGKIGTSSSITEQTTGLEIVRGALQDAMREIRNISSGFALPQLDRMGLDEVLQLVVRNHEKRTGTRVQTDFHTTNIGDISNTAKECIYRFLQEALNNSFRHAEGKEQKVSISDEAGFLLVQASDNGPGLKTEGASIFDGRLGLIGLRGRVESLGGELLIDSVRGQGTTLTARLSRLQISDQDSANEG